MPRRPLPSILTRRPPTGLLPPGAVPVLDRGRLLARTAGDHAAETLRPLVVVGRGLRRQAGWAVGWWRAAPRDRRGPALLLAVAGVMVVALLPYGPVIAGITVLSCAAWQGRDRAPAAEPGPDAAQAARLRALYEALVPHLADPGHPDDPAPLYTRGGDPEPAFTRYAFDGGRLTLLCLRYPASFPDGDPEARAGVERVLHAKAGRGREYRFDWDEEDNRLTLTALAPLETGIAAQRFITAPGEAVLGFTDEPDVRRTIPVRDAAGGRDAAPVVWRTGARSTEPHLLAAGRPGCGVTTLLRSLALQALQHGDLLVADGAGTGEYAFLLGRPGVLAVESGVAGTLAALEWLAHETQRRLIAVNRARQAGRPVPPDVRRPLWAVVDRPATLSQLARAEGRPDPQDLLETPLRHGRAANVTVAVGEELDAVEALADTVAAHTRARVLLGAAAHARARQVLGAPPHTTPCAHPPAGRGYARLGDGPVRRVQVPATPDPHDEETADGHRRAVLALLPAGPPPVGLAKAAGPAGGGAAQATSEPAP